MIKREELESGVFVTIRHAPRSVAVEKVMALRAVKCAFMVELTCAALFVVSVLVYLPVLYDPVPVDHLSINDVGHLSRLPRWVTGVRDGSVVFSL